jgi:hypothetical protein
MKQTQAPAYPAAAPDETFEDIFADLLRDYPEFAAFFDALPAAPFPTGDFAAAAITERQLRALNRKHLLVMILDLENELARERAEKENLFRTYQAGRSAGMADTVGR